MQTAFIAFAQRVDGENWLIRKFPRPLESTSPRSMTRCFWVEKRHDRDEQKRWVKENIFDESLFYFQTINLILQNYKWNFVYVHVLA